MLSTRGPHVSGDKVSRMSLRYFAGYSLHFLARLLEKGLAQMWRVVSLPRQFALIIWTPSEIDRYARDEWNGWPTVQGYEIGRAHV